MLNLPYVKLNVCDDTYIRWI